MNKAPTFIIALLALAIVIVFSLIIARHRSESPTPVATAQPMPEPATPTKAAPTVESKPNAAKSALKSTGGTVIAEKTFDARKKVTVSIADTVSPADMTPFLQSPIAGKWVNELGYTPAQLVEAQKELRKQGAPERTVNDAGAIMRTLPPRHMGSVSITDITIPAQARAGSAIPFTIHGTAPHPTFQFTHVETLIQGSVIRLAARGNSDGDNEAGSGGPVAIKGEIGPLPPGDYHVEIPELGPEGSRALVVTEQ